MRSFLEHYTGPQCTAHPPSSFQDGFGRQEWRVLWSYGLEHNKSDVFCQNRNKLFDAHKLIEGASFISLAYPERHAPYISAKQMWLDQILFRQGYINGDCRASLYHAWPNIYSISSTSRCTSEEEARWQKHGVDRGQGADALPRFLFQKKKKRWVRASPRKRTGRVWSACLFTLCALAVRLYVTSIRPCRPTALPCLPPPKNVCCSSRLAGLPHPFWVLVLIINLITRWTWSVRRH